MKKSFLLIVASLFLSMTMIAQDYHWSGFDYHDFTQHMNIIGKAYLDGELQNRPNIEVATFVNGELRGTKYLVEPYPSSMPGEYFVWTACYYDNLGETFTFKAYDHDNAIEYDLCDIEVIGQQSTQGTVSDPLVMHFTKSPSFGPDYPWIPSTSYFGNGMMVTAQIQIDGEPVDRDSWELGAFCEDECRGDITPLTDWTDVDLGYFADINIKGNDGDVIRFYLYDTQAGHVFVGECPTTVVLENDTYIGQDVFGDRFVLNFLSTPFWTLDINAYTATGGWYLISSPLDGEAVVTDIQGMTTNTYDLFYFDQEQEKEWVNYKPGEGNANPGFNLESGKGYLYANSADVRLVFAGDPYEGDGTVQIDSVPGHSAAGWNLIGNPFTYDCTIGRSYYRMNSLGEELIAGTSTEVIAPMEGVFVYTNQLSEYVTFAAPTKLNADEMIVIDLSRGDREVIDRVMVNMGEDNTLPKYMFDESHANISIQQGDRKYAVVNGDDAVMMPVNFKADRVGEYVLTAKLENTDVEYLHLYDRITGADVDMLAEGSYTFAGVPSDMESRFILSFTESMNSCPEVFAYQSGSDIIVSGEGTLYVYDMMGRFVNAYELNGVETLRDIPAGVYIFRILGEAPRTQKIVVR